MKFSGPVVPGRAPETSSGKRDIGAPLHLMTADNTLLVDDNGEAIPFIYEVVLRSQAGDIVVMEIKRFIYAEPDERFPKVAVRRVEDEMEVFEFIVSSFEVNTQERFALIGKD